VVFLLPQAEWIAITGLDILNHRSIDAPLGSIVHLVGVLILVLVLLQILDLSFSQWIDLNTLIDFLKDCVQP